MRSSRATQEEPPRKAAATRGPKRKRGRLRVEAILAGAAEVFMAKGFGAATMTEIAARSKTAVGSLYRFFPTKEAVADALLSSYGDRVARDLGAIADRAASLSPSALADEFVDFMLDIQADRAAAVALADAWGERRGRASASTRRCPARSPGAWSRWRRRVR